MTNNGITSGIFSFLQKRKKTLNDRISYEESKTKVIENNEDIKTEVKRLEAWNFYTKAILLFFVVLLSFTLQYNSKAELQSTMSKIDYEELLVAEETNVSAQDRREFFSKLRKDAREAHRVDQLANGLVFASSTLILFLFSQIVTSCYYKTSIRSINAKIDSKIKEEAK